MLLQPLLQQWPLAYAFQESLLPVILVSLTLAEFRLPRLRELRFYPLLHLESTGVERRAV